jgi:hypothetical protein
MSRASVSDATLWLLAISRALAILKRMTSVELLGTYMGQFMAHREWATRQLLSVR